MATKGDEAGWWSTGAGEEATRLGVARHPRVQAREGGAGGETERRRRGCGREGAGVSDSQKKRQDSLADRAPESGADGSRFAGEQHAERR